MRFRRIRANQEEGIGGLNIGIGSHGFICAIGGNKARHGTCHTGTGIALHIVRANARTENLLHGVSFFGKGLTGTIEAYGIRAVIFNGLLEFGHHQIHGFVPTGFHELTIFSYQRMQQAVLGIHNLRQQDALHAQPAFVDRTIRVAFYSHNLAAGNTGQHPAAGATVTADPLDPLFRILLLYRALVRISLCPAACRKHGCRNGHSLQKITSGKFHIHCRPSLQ